MWKKDQKNLDQNPNFFQKGLKQKSPLNRRVPIYDSDLGVYIFGICFIV